MTEARRSMIINPSQLRTSDLTQMSSMQSAASTFTHSPRNVSQQRISSPDPSQIPLPHSPSVLSIAEIQPVSFASVWIADYGKEAVPGPESAGLQWSAGPTNSLYLDEKDGLELTTKKRRYCPCIPLIPVWAVILVVLAMLSLLLGLAIGLSLKHRSRSNTTQSGLNSVYLSQTGAFNGSGIALSSNSFGVGGYGVINVYYQHWNSELRRLQLMKDGSWQAADRWATDAKNGTPISAVSYALDNKATWHLFYIDKSNIIKEKIMDNTTNIWRDGPINQLKLKAMDHTNVGLQACWYGSFYGTPNQNQTSKDSVIGMHLWYGKDSTTLEEVNWTYNTTDWSRQDNFTANAHAGIGCYSWGEGSVSYVMMVNLDNQVNLLWKDLNTTIRSTPIHPIDKWTNTSVVIPNVMQNTSLGFTNFFYAQLQDSKIGGYNIDFQAENSSIVSEDTFEIPEVPIKGTHFSVTTLPDASGGDSIVVLNQLNGSDITESLRDIKSGQWTYVTLPVPSGI